MELLARAGYNVLPLSEAVNRLQHGTLPDRAVVITFDDGLHDFYSVALPILESFGYPVTLYLTTYYVEFNRPVFDPMCFLPDVEAERHKPCWNGRRYSPARLRWTMPAVNERLRDPAICDVT